MDITISTSGYKIIHTGIAILYEPNSELKITIAPGNKFVFNIILDFIKDDNEGQKLDSKVEGNTIFFNCTNFNNPLGTGTQNPLFIATISGKEWYFHFWSYFMGNGVRKVEYTIFEKNG